MRVFYKNALMSHGRTRHHIILTKMELSSPLFVISTLICSVAAVLVKIKVVPIVPNFLQLIKNIRRMHEWTAELLVASPTGTITVAPFVFTADPSNVDHISKSRFENYPKGLAMTTMIHDFLGHGIFNSDGDTWRSQRKAASLEFTTRSLRSFVLDVVHHKALDRLVPFLARAGQSEDVLDLDDVLERFSFDNICSLVLGEDPRCFGSESEDGERFYLAFGEATVLSTRRWYYPFHWMWKLMRWLGVGTERRLRESMAVVHESVDRLIRARRRGGGCSDCSSDLLSRFADDREHSEEFVRDLLISLVLAGRDTTPSAMTWFFWVLSSRPDVVEKILEELRSIRSKDHNGNDDGFFTLDELRQMHYLHAALSESMRLHPPVPLLPRECQEDDVLPDGTKVRKGWTVMYSAYMMGRTESIWGEDCLGFRPERWLEDGVFQPKDPTRYPVFHVGSRVCLGREMAYIQMKALTATILERFEFEVVEERGRHQVGITLRIAGGLPVRVKKRKRDLKGLFM